MTGRRGRTWSTALLAVMCACLPPRDRMQTVIIVDADPAVRAVVSHVVANVRSKTDDAQDQLSSEAALVWPLRLPIAPKYDDPTRKFAVEITALDDQYQARVSFSVSAGFVREASRYVRVKLLDRCMGPAESVCTTSDCNTIELANELLSANDQTPVHDVRCADKPPPTEPDTMPPVTMTMPEAGTGAAGMPAIDTPTVVAGSSAKPAGTGGEAGQSGTPGTQDFCMLQRCGDNGRCINGPTDYTCACDTGYEDNGATCVDIDECQSDMAHCSGECQNSKGGYKCLCPTGSWLKEDGHSCGSNATPQKLNGSSSLFPTEPDIAFDADGNGLAVWTHADAMQFTLWSARYVAGQGWSPPLQIPGAGGTQLLFSPRVVLDNAQSGLVVWTQAPDNTKPWELWGAAFTNGSFQAAQRVPGTVTTNSALLPYVALDSGGNGIVVWTSYVGARPETWGVRWNKASAMFVSPGRIAGSGTAGSAAELGRPALESLGTGYIVWGQSEFDSDAGMAVGSSYKPYYSDYTPADAATPLGAAVQLDTELGVIPDLSIAADGGGFIVWQRMTPAGFALVSSRIAPDLAPAAGVVLSTAASDKPTIAPRVFAAPGGAAVAMWTQLQGSARSIWGATIAGADAAWSVARKLNTTDSIEPQSNTTLPVDSNIDLAIDPKGFGYGAWSDYATDGRVIWLRHVNTTTGFEEPVTLDADASTSFTSHVQLGLDARGDGAAIWDRQTAPTQYDVWTSRLQ